ncbi:hypothetical protein C8J57DRAFT_1314558 [Mycena rebaudengoi]|nr:hypothetical protein C8J57DRAFT_1314558 [Mycena rebaudengoi]
MHTPTSMVSARAHRPAPYSMSSSECSIPIRRYNCKEDLRVIKVQNIRFHVNASTLCAGSPIFKVLLKPPNAPIILSGHTAPQFRAFLAAVYTNPLPAATNLTIGRLSSIAEVSFTYRFDSLKAWALGGINALVNSPDTLLRTAPSETFVRLIRLALMCHDTALVRSIQSKWLTRLHWHDLPPAPAIMVADACDLRHLLSHAYYVHLVDVAHRITNGQRIDVGSPLSATQNIHVLCGYHSLAASWKHLQEVPPTFTPDTECTVHDRCLVAWKARWAFEAGRPSAFSPVDVLCRLLFMERHLAADAILSKCMTEGCRAAALHAIEQKRAEISGSLHHHFDL